MGDGASFPIVEFEGRRPDVGPPTQKPWGYLCGEWKKGGRTDTRRYGLPSSLQGDHEDRPYARLRGRGLPSPEGCGTDDDHHCSGDDPDDQAPIGV